MAAIVLFVALGATNSLGYREGSVTASSGAVTARLEHPLITRGGLPTRWRLWIVRTDGGRLGEVEVRVENELFELLDHNDLVPTPDAVELDAQWTTWTFSDVSGSELVVRLDVRTEPDARWGHTSTTSVTAAGATLELAATTWVLP